MDLAALRARLELHGQQHVLAFWERLTEPQREHLASQLEQIDLQLVHRLASQATEAEDWAALAARAEPPPAIRLADATAARQAEARRAGEQLLRAGRVAAVLVAGGQGTRLGFPHPKGMFPLGPVSGHSLFQMFIEQIRAAAKYYGCSIPLWLMTSPATDEPTREFLTRHDRFGLAADQLYIFCQGVMPAVDADSGKLLLEAPDALAVSPDG